MPTRNYAQIQQTILDMENVLTFALDDWGEESPLIPWSVFFELLYVDHDAEDEEQIRIALQEADQMWIVVAPCGGGKTTFLLHALRAYKRDTSHLAFVFDFEASAELFYELEKNWPVQLPALQGILRTHVLNTFIRYDYSLNVEFIRLALLSYYPDRILEIDMKIREDTDLVLNADTLGDVLLNRPDILERENDFIRSKLPFGACVATIKRLLGASAFVVCFDNVDRLPVDVQPYLLSLAVDSYHGGRGSYGTVVTLREKNILRYREVGSDGDTVNFINLSGTPEMAKQLRMQSPNEPFVKKMFELRQEYALESYLVERLGTSDPELLAVLKAAFAIVNSQFVSQKLYNLANHSYREMLTLNCGFARYLTRLVYENVVTFDNDHIVESDANLRSYLYRWIYAAVNPQHEWLRDPFETFMLYGKGKIPNPIDCDLEWMVLTWLHNNGGQATFGRLYDAFEVVGVSPDQIRRATYSLYNCRKPIQRHVELGTAERKLLVADCVPSTLVILTPLGKEFITSTLLKFEFMLQAMSTQSCMNEDSLEMLQPIEHASRKAMQQMYERLLFIKNAHSSALQGIRDALSRDDWEHFYRVHFCINEQLSLERIADNHWFHIRTLPREVSDVAASLYSRLFHAYFSEVGLTTSVPTFAYD